ncbi:MAG: PIG-L deacetylase family protein [Candidatus Binatia bacterium]
MLELAFTTPSDGEYRVLCLGAHCDDIEIGCGGTLLKLARAIPNLTVRWEVFSSTPVREREARLSAQAFLRDVAHPTVSVHAFRDGFFPSLTTEIKEHFEWLKGEFAPDLIFTHYRNDLHQDHRVIAELTWNTFRNHFVLEYEVPKYDGDFGQPNVFVALEDHLCQQKMQYLQEYFVTQREKSWFCPQIFSAVLRLRGMEASAPTHFAEAFYCRKLRLRLLPTPPNTDQ